MADMRKVAALAVVVGFLVTAHAARAVTLVYPNGQPLGLTNIWQRWANEAKVPTTSAEVTFTDDPTVIKRMCASADEAYAGCATDWTLSQNGGPQQIEGRPFIGIMRDRHCERGGSFGSCYLGTFYHELGHVFDFTMLSDQDRRAFMSIFPRRVRCAWCASTADVWDYNFPGRDAVDTNGPYVEWWAEAYRICAQHSDSGWVPADGMNGEGVLYAYPEWRVNWPLWARHYRRHARAVVARLERKQARVCSLIRSAATHGAMTPSIAGSVTPGLTS